MTGERTAPPSLLKGGPPMKRVFMFLGLLALASCAGRAILDREPDYLANFSGSPEAVARCVTNEWFNQFGGHPLVTSTRDGLLRVSSSSYSPYVVLLIWELTLRPDGVAELRGFPTVWGWVQGEEVIPLVEKCGKSKP